MQAVLSLLPGVLNGVLGRKDRNNLEEDADYAEMLFVLLNWPGDNNNILCLPLIDSQSAFAALERKKTVLYLAVCRKLGA